MPIDLPHPDLSMSLALDPYAPRAARYHVSQVDRPSPDLRNTVVLLTSELVTRALQHGAPAGATMQLRAWMPADVVRVELRAARPHRACRGEVGGLHGLRARNDVEHDREDAVA